METKIVQVLEEFNAILIVSHLDKRNVRPYATKIKHNTLPIFVLTVLPIAFSNCGVTGPSCAERSTLSSLDQSYIKQHINTIVLA